MIVRFFAEYIFTTATIGADNADFINMGGAVALAGNNNVENASAIARATPIVGASN